MKHVHLFFLIILLSFSACTPSEYVLKIVNPAAFNRSDEPVIIRRQMAEKWLHRDLKHRNLMLLCGKDTIPSQCDDVDGDGVWDELFFLCNVPASDSIVLKLVPVKVLPAYNVRTDIHMEKYKTYKEVKTAQRIRGTDTKVTSKVYHLEGPSWENDRVAFRNYLDERNGMDIYGKVTDTMVLNYIGRGVSYHEMGAWGMDILEVGRSLGAGGVAVLNADTLVRGGIPSEGGYQLISKGPLRSQFRLSFNNWTFGCHTWNMEQDIAIWGGLYGYESRVTLSGIDTAQLVAGIVKLHSDSLYVLDDNPEYLVLATYDHQAFKGENLGLALIVPRDVYFGSGKAPDSGHDVVSTYYARLKAVNNTPVIFRFYAGWELSDKRFTSREGFMQYLRNEALCMEYPLSVTGY